jgi:PleD family two-component response regulator
VYILSTAEKLLSIADTVKPELILLAVKIPVTDGYGMIQELKNSKLTADIPIIAISSSIDCDVIAKCFELGVVDFIAKPIFANDLLNRIEHHFQN